MMLEYKTGNFFHSLSFIKARRKGLCLVKSYFILQTRYNVWKIKNTLHMSEDGCAKLHTFLKK